MKKLLAISCWLMALSAPASAQSTANLIDYWKLNEASGNATPAHSTNTLTDGNAVGTAAGKLGTSRDFEATSNQYLSAADSPALSTGNIDFTIAGWVQLESEAAVMYCLSKYNATGGQREWVIYYRNTTDRFEFVVSSNGVAATAIVAETFGAPTTGVWYYIVAWHDAANDQLGISVNDVANTASYADGVFDSTAAFQLGRIATDTVNDWDGLIDEVEYTKRVMPASERTRRYNAGNGLAYPWSQTILFQSQQ